MGSALYNRRAQAYRSTDGGATWTRAQSEVPIAGLADVFSRDYFGGVVNGSSVPSGVPE
jgi:hypothetical protein